MVEVHQGVFHQVVQVLLPTLQLFVCLLTAQAVATAAPTVGIVLHHPVERHIELIAPHGPVLTVDDAGLFSNGQHIVAVLLELGMNLAVQSGANLAFFRGSGVQRAPCGHLVFCEQALGHIQEWLVLCDDLFPLLAGIRKLAHLLRGLAGDGLHLDDVLQLALGFGCLGDGILVALDDGVRTVRGHPGKEPLHLGRPAQLLQRCGQATIGCTFQADDLLLRVHLNAARLHHGIQCPGPSR